MSIHNLYDKGHKLLFSHPKMVKDLLLGFLKEEWVQNLDFDTLERVNSVYTTDSLRKRESDILWRLRFKNQWLYIYLLIEAQSSIEQFMAVRMLTYVGLSYLDLIKQDVEIKRTGKLPPIFPIVIYNGERPWRVPLNFQGLLMSGVPKALKPYQPELYYYLLDEGRNEFANDIIKTGNAVASLIAIEQSSQLKEIPLIIKQLDEQLKHPKHDSLRRAFVVYLSNFFKDKDVLPAEVELNELSEVPGMLAEKMDIWADNFIKEGEIRGETRGEKLGREKEARRIAKDLLARGVALPLIAEVSKLPLTTIQSLSEDAETISG